MTYLLNYWYNHILNIIAGFLTWILMYFIDMKGTITLMAITFLIDLIVGIWASIKVKKEKFSSQKFFIQLERFALVLIISMLLFAMDKENQQSVASLSNGVTWLVTGFLVWSIAENGFAITGWKLFKILKAFVKNKIQQNTDINIEQDEQN